MKRTFLLAMVASLGLGCAHHRLPPASMMMHPGPGVDGPGPGVMGAMPARSFPTVQSQIHFSSPGEMQIGWQTPNMGGPPTYSEAQVTAPGRYNFSQGRIYQLKLTQIPDRPGLELYPTLEVAPASPKTDAYLAHNTVPVGFTDEDFEQVQSGNMVTKVIYLPDPEHQELAIAGVETLVSTRLAPGIDPVIEADRRGTILALVRMGGINRELPGGDGRMAMMVPPGLAVAGPGPARGGIVGAGTSPSWGMPMSGTPIGLPGPPHIPLGGPAGLKRHRIYNHTSVHMPQPVETFNIDVKHHPGIHMPAPVRRVKIREHIFGR